ncbi:hypothetical protein EJ04DRAFT_514606 [Polyplosphaeria fusca]|uniref:Uncharacterized protein n=1 Tax=Polyplosphaeria fusca TaxID=682080 RepID=A0A9P4UYI9_9PLEO|nr:hypothetical protein EJ04DRAFT_514606 [Polyplosphaeria fusca]
MDNGQIEYLTGFGSKDIVARGNIGLVCFDARSQPVIKTSHDETHSTSLTIDERI